MANLGDVMTVTATSPLTAQFQGPAGDATSLQGVNVSSTTPNTGDFYTGVPSGMGPVPKGAGIISDGTVVKVDTAALAGTGLQSGVDELEVNVTILAGAGIKNDGFGKFAVDYDTVATQLAGSGLDSITGVLSVDPDDFDGAGLKVDLSSNLEVDYDAVATQLAGSGLVATAGIIDVEKMTALADLTQSISSSPTQTEVENIQSKLNDLLGRLRTGNFLSTT